jgi:diguanylate cyclase (GGDEF)-like protein
LRAWVVTVTAGFAFFVIHATVGLGGPGLDRFTYVWVSDGLELLAATGCLLRCIWIPSERWVWGVLALGLYSFALGDVCYDFVYDGNPPTPSVADAFYLGFYPACYAALALLISKRISAFNPSVWLDGLIAGLTTAAVSTAIVFEVVLENVSGNVSTVVVDLAYPIGDAVLLGIVVGVFAITGWRPGRAWAAVGSAFVVITVADSVFLYLNATGGYSEGTVLDVLWPAGMLLLAASAWQAVNRGRGIELSGRFLPATPLVCGAVALCVIVVSGLRHINALTIGLAAAAIVTVLVRTALSFRDNAQLLEHERIRSHTDHLTGLGNRRKLMLDLTRELERDDPAPLLLVLFDLNGFKRYNDTFGHPSGDALLARLGAKLAAAAGPAGEAYRLGGDEFCTLGPLVDGVLEAQIDASMAALAEHGEGFSIAAEYGAAVLPVEAADPTSALRLADQRLYTHKHAGQRDQAASHEVLLRALSEREPSLREHGRGVAELSVLVGARLGMGGQTLNDLRLAAELHDVGKLAIPDAVLQKPGKLTESEWEFIRQHTVIGQRILAGAPALESIGEIVRATHERWDGTGYVDGLAASAIPLAARIIAACDAYGAMTSDRPYQAAMTAAEARAEIVRGAGSQFDPEVARALCQVLWDVEAELETPALAG